MSNARPPYSIATHEPGLLHHAMFAGVQHETLGQFFSYCSVTTVGTGDVVLNEGQVSDFTYLALSGAYKVGITTPQGKNITLVILGPGELLGEMSMLDGSSPSASITVVRSGRLLRMPQRQLQVLADYHPGVMRYLAQLLAVRLRRLSRTCVDLATKDAGTRLAERLRDLGDLFGEQSPEGVLLDLALTQQDLGDLVGATRERVNQLLSHWAKDGAIRRLQGSLVLIDLPV